MPEFSSTTEIDGTEPAVHEEFKIEESEEELNCLSFGKKCTGFSEAYLLIQKKQLEKNKLLKEIARLGHEQDKTLAFFGSEVFDLEKLLQDIGQKEVAKEHLLELKGLEIILKRMWAALHERDVDVLDMSGKLVNDEMLKSVQVLKYINEPGVSEPIIKETKTPVIYREGRLIQMGLVIITVGENEN